jgi:hypothetical protein
MQKARLHMAHVAAGARKLKCGDDLTAEEWVESGMMVLLEKHVHLQNDGGAKRSLAIARRWILYPLDGGI